MTLGFAYSWLRCNCREVCRIRKGRLPLLLPSSLLEPSHLAACPHRNSYFTQVGAIGRETIAAMWCSVPQMASQLSESLWLSRYCVNANLILSIFASLKLTHLQLIVQRCYQWSGLQELFPGSREHAAGMGTSQHHPKFPFYRVIWGRILVLQFCAQVAPGFLCNRSAVHPRIALEGFSGFSALWST